MDMGIIKILVVCLFFEFIKTTNAYLTNYFNCGDVCMYIIQYTYELVCNLFFKKKDKTKYVKNIPKK